MRPNISQNMQTVSVRKRIVQLVANHFAIGGMPDVWCLLFCVASTQLWARIAVKLANKARAVTLNRAIGIVLAVLGAVILGVNYLK